MLGERAGFAGTDLRRMGRAPYGLVDTALLVVDGFAARPAFPYCDRAVEPIEGAHVGPGARCSSDRGGGNGPPVLTADMNGAPLPTYVSTTVGLLCSIA